MNPIAFALLLAVLGLYSVAVAKLVSWWLDRRDARLLQNLRLDQMEAEGKALLGKRRAQEQQWRNAA